MWKENKGNDRKVCTLINHPTGASYGRESNFLSSQPLYVDQALASMCKPEAFLSPSSTLSLSHIFI